MKTITIPAQKTPHFSMPSHIVTIERDLSNLKKTLSPSDQNHFFELYELAQTAPRKARPQVEALLGTYPHHSEILNLLTYIYIVLRKKRAARTLIVENYEHNPDSLLAKINYADLCLQMQRVEEVPKIFNEAWHLRAICPKRKQFHLAEFRGFMTLMAHYHFAINKLEIADCYFYLTHRVDPHHPSVQILKKKLYRRSFLAKLKSRGFHQKLFRA